MTASTFQAGIGRVVITPPLTAPHASWGAQVHVLPDGVDADLWATVLVVEDGATRAAWVDLDLVVITREQTAAIQARVAEVLGIPPGHVRVTVTHNHAGPPPNTWNWTSEGQAALDAYYAQLPEYAAGAARAALHTMQSAQVGAGLGQSRVAVNRRETAPGGRTITGVNFAGPIDPDVLVTRIDTTAGAPLAVIVGYTMHPTTMGPSNRVVSPDWPGYLKRTVESLTGATCIFAQGAAGDVGPGPDGFTDDLRVIRRLGTAVGSEAARVYFELDVPARTFRHERIWESGAPLGKWTSEPALATPVPVRVRTLRVPMPLIEHPPATRTAAELQAAQARLQALKDAGAPAAEVEAATFVTKRANMRHSRSQQYGGQETHDVALSLLQIGPVVFAGTEGEPFCATARAVKDASPFPFTWFGGYTSGWAGYIPTPEEYPRAGYEVETSPFAPPAAGALQEATIAALRELSAAEETQ